MEMHSLDLREKRFRAQQRISELEDGPEKDDLLAMIKDLQAICAHTHFDEDPEQGWRCRNCDLTRPPEPAAEEPVAAQAAEPVADAVV